MKEQVISFLIGLVTYTLFALLSIYFSYQNTSVSSVWYANIVMGFILSKSKKNQWPLIILGILIGNSLSGIIAGKEEYISSLYFLLGNLVETLSIALVVSSTRKNLLSSDLLDFLRAFASILILPSLIGATVGSFPLAIYTTEEFHQLWGTWFFSSVLGGLTFMPILVSELRSGCFIYLKKLKKPAVIATIFGAVITHYILLSYLSFPFLYSAFITTLVALYFKLPVISILVSSISFTTTIFFSMNLESNVEINNLLLDILLPLSFTLISPLILTIGIEESRSRKRENSRLVNKLQRMYDNTPALLHSIDTKGNIVAVSNQWLEWLGYSRKEVIGKHTSTFMTAESAYLAKNKVLPDFFKKGEVSNVEYKFVSKSGEIKDTSLSSILEEGADQEGKFSLTVIQDITSEVKLSQKLEEEKEFLEVTLNSIGDGVITTDTNGVINYFNPVAKRVLDLEQSCLGEMFSSVICVFDSETKKQEDCPISYALTSKTKHAFRSNVGLKSSNKTVQCVQQTTTLIQHNDKSLQGAVMVFQDISELNDITKKMGFLASHDSLTGLPNRRYLQEYLHGLCSDCLKLKSQFAVLFLDLDSFKIINDTLGHAKGDELLHIVAKRLSNQLPSSVFISRLGGDEFVVVVPKTDKTSEISNICEDINKLVSKKMNLGRTTHEISTSIGVSFFPKDSTDVDGLMKAADTAMYEAKREGKNRFSFYSEELAEEAKRKLRTKQLIRVGLDKKYFTLFFQPIVEAKTKRILGFESLCRCISNEGQELIRPVDFIAIAEETGKLIEIGMETFPILINQLKKCQNTIGGYTYSFNLSTVQINSDEFINFLMETIQLAGVNPTLIVFEVTESVFISNPSRANTVFRKFRGLGCKIALDDFGTGYSSLSYLKNFEFDYLKIDRSFVKDLDIGDRDIVFLKAIINMAQALNIKVLAEGVETQTQSKILAHLGCEYLQGYLFSKPKANILDTLTPFDS